MSFIRCLKSRKIIRMLTAVLLLEGMLIPTANATTYYYQAYVDNLGAMNQVQNEWQDYFGAHKSSGAAEPWDTVRAPDWTGWRLRDRKERTGPDLTRPYGEGTIKLRITDMFNGNNPTTKMDAALTTLQNNSKDGIFNIFDRVEALPLDRDEAYYVAKLMYETSTTWNKDHLFIQLGNEVNGNGQWNPWPNALNEANAYGPTVGSLKINNPDKIRPYAEALLVEACKGIFEASGALYSIGGQPDRRAIKILGPSVQFSYEDETLQWYKELMDHTIQGSYTDPSTLTVIDTPTSNMEGYPVSDYVDIISIQYPFGVTNNEGLDSGRTTLQSWHDTFLVGQGAADPRAEGMWVTEEAASGGPRQAVRRAVRFMDFVGDNDLDPMQTRLVWTNYQQAVSTEPNAGGYGPALTKMDTYMSDGAFKMDAQSFGTPTEHSRIYLFVNDSDSSEARIMAILDPLLTDMTAGSIRFHLPSAYEGDRTWTIDAWQTFYDDVGATISTSYVLENNYTELKLTLDAAMDQYAPILISLTASLNPEPTSLGILTIGGTALLIRRSGGSRPSGFSKGSHDKCHRV